MRSFRARRASSAARRRRRAFGVCEHLERRLAPAVAVGFHPELFAKDASAEAQLLGSPAIEVAVSPAAAMPAAAYFRAASLDGFTAAEIEAASRWVVLLMPGTDPARAAVAAGAIASEPAPVLADTHIWTFPESTPGLSDRLLTLQGRSPAIAAAYPLIAREYTKQLIPNDPLFANQWHLQNTGQGGGAVGEDARVTSVWDEYLGTGVLLAIVDDGLERTHPDLAARYVAAASFDFLGNDPDPMPVLADDNHGTAVAGVAAATGNNSLGVSGAAPGASLAGLRLIGGPITDLQIASTLTFALDDIDVYNNSWGPSPGGIATPGPLTRAALERGVTEGRDGRGVVYVFSAGNDLQANDNVNYNGYANSRYTIAVTAIDNFGRQSWYAEPGAPILVAAHSDGDTLGIVTTDRIGLAGYNPAATTAGGDYTTAVPVSTSFGGTSSSAPLVSGVVALMLEANPQLSWRDVQHVLVDSARRNDPSDADWRQNGSGRWVNHKYGYGAVDAAAAVALAETWTAVAPETTAGSGTQTVGRTIPDNNQTGISSSFTMSADLTTEWIEVTFAATHAYRGDLEVVLTSPAGTRSVLAEKRDDAGDNYSNWTFTSARHWGESAAGTWTLTVRDLAAQDVGTWNSWSLDVYGTPPAPIATITANPAGPIGGGGTATIQFTTSEPTADFDSDDVTVTNGTLSGFTGVGTSYSAVFTPQPGFAGTATISVAAGTFTGLDGSTNQASSLQLPVDTIQPTVTISRLGSGTLTIGDSSLLTFTLSEPASDFAVGDISVVGGVISGFTGSGNSYTVLFTPSEGFAGSATVSVGAGAFTDAAGNPNLASDSLTIPIDAVAPTVSITRSGSGTLVGGATDTITMRLSSPTTGFTASDIRVTNGTLSGFTGSGMNYTAVFRPAAGYQGSAVVSIPAGSFTNAAGNPNAAASLVIPVDDVPPSLRISRSGTGLLTAGSTTTITFTVSEPVTTFGRADVIVTGGTLSSLTGSGAVYVATFVPVPGFTGVASLSVPAAAFTDPAGYANSAASLQIPVDAARPTVTLSRSGTSQLMVGDTMAITFRLSEQSRNFSLASVSATGGNLVNLQGSGTLYTATFVPARQFRGTATITVPADRFTDLAGNGNLAGNLVSVPVNTLAPLLTGFTANPSVARLRIGDSVRIRASFSEPVTAGARFTVVLNSGGRARLVVSRSGRDAEGVYTAQPGEETADLDVTGIVGAAGVQNAFGNPLEGTLPPAATSLAARHAIVVDAAVKFVASGLFSTNPAIVPDAGGRFRRIPIVFTTPVTGVRATSFALALDGQALSMQGARIVGRGARYELLLPVTRVNPIGIYTLSAAPGGGIRAASNGAAASARAMLSWGYRASIGMVPDAPASVTAGNVTQSGGRTSVVVNWTAPAGKGGGPVTGYVVDYRIIGSTRWTAVRDPIPVSPSPRITIGGMAPGKQYEFRVAARNAAGLGEFATSAAFAIEPELPPTPLLTPLESRGTVTLAHDPSGRLYANGKAINFGGTAVNFYLTKSQGWTIVAADVDRGRNTVVLRHASNALFFWRMDAAWRQLSGDSWTPAGTTGFFTAEVNFATDFDGDGSIGLTLTPIESAGRVSLATDSKGNLRANGVLITFNGSPVNRAAVAASGWTIVAADVENGRNTVVLRHSSNALFFWRMDAAWRQLSGDGWTRAGTSGYFRAEVSFATDFNGNGRIGA